MRTFFPARDFLGYPDGKTPVQFKAGEESQLVSEAFADLMFVKGLVDETKTARREPSNLDPPQPAVAKKIAAATKSHRPGKTARQPKG
jgi:hypothetical protein